MTRSAPDFRFALTFLFVTSLLDSIGLGIIVPVLPELIMQIAQTNLASAAAYGGWLMFAFAFMQFLCAPLLGNISDRYGRRPVLLISLFVMAVNYLLMAMATSLVWLFVGRIISGIGASTMSTCNAYIADVTPEESRAKNFGIIGAAFGLGFVIGPALGGLLGEIGPRMPFYFAAALALINMGFGFVVLRESLAKHKRRNFSWRRANPLGTFVSLTRVPIVMGILATIFMFNLGHHVLPATWSFYTIEKFSWSPAEIGFSLSFVGIMMAFVQGFLIRFLLPLTGERLAGILGLSFSIVAFIGYGLATSPVLIYLALIPGALGAISSPAMQSIASAQVDSDQQGELQGGLSAIMSLASIISPLVMTQLFGYFTLGPVYFPGAPYILAACLTFISLWLFIATTKRIPQPKG